MPLVPKIIKILNGTNCLKLGITFLLIYINIYVIAQVKLLSKDFEYLKDSSTIGELNKYTLNVEMSSLYKELNSFSTIAPFGEIFSGTKYIFTADINPLYIFSNSIRSRWNLGIGARVIARMFSEDSYPIRTPSYMPTIKLFYRISNEMQSYKYLDLSFTHHSNGQDGEAKINDEWNIKNGNFSTNWIKLSYNWGENNDPKRLHKSIYVIQHAELGNVLSQDDYINGYYGQTRIGLNIMFRTIQNIRVINRSTNVTYFRYAKERLRMNVNFEYTLLGLKNYIKYDLKRRINIETQGFYFLKSLKEGAFFLGLGYYGEDPYNIFFHRNYFFARFGIAAGTPYFRTK